MGYAMGMGNCVACGNIFAFNPHRVPSIRVKGVKEPVCRRCIELANPQRKAMGLPEFVIQPDAYNPIDENEL